MSSKRNTNNINICKTLLNVLLDRKTIRLLTLDNTSELDGDRIHEGNNINIPTIQKRFNIKKMLIYLWKL